MPPAISIPVFGDKNHLGLDRRYGFIRTQKVTDAAAYRSVKNGDYLEGIGKTSRIHRKKPAGRPLSRATAKANARTSKARCHVEHVFAELKSRMGLVVRTIGIARAEAAIPLANMAFNMKRWVFLDARILPE